MQESVFHDIVRCKNGEAKEVRDELIVEYPLALLVDGELSVSFACTPNHVEELVVGHLWSEGYVNQLDELVDLRWEKEYGVFRAQTRRLDPREKKENHEGEGSSVLPVSLLCQAIAEMEKRARLHAATGAAHIAGLYDVEGKQLVFREDVGRHNAVDKVMGFLLREGIEPTRVCLVCSGRISGQMMEKAIRVGLFGVISRAAATDRAVELARRSDVLTVGFVRGKRANVYHGRGRLVVD